MVVYVKALQNQTYVVYMKAGFLNGVDVKKVPQKSEDWVCNYLLCHLSSKDHVGD